LRVRVRFGETDAAGIVYYGTYFLWFDAATAGLIRIPGEPAVVADGKPRFPLPLVEVGATFRLPVRFDQELDIISTAAKIGETSLRVEHEVRTLDGDLVARGFEQRVYCRIDGGRFEKEPLPNELRQHLTAASG
jgi:YbgC/YbaW family acyl-CoA thioester hydrolase